MEIITSYSKTEFEQIIEASVQKVLNGKLNPPQPEPVDNISLEEACRITGLRKPTIYKETSAGTMPCSRYGSRLMFSRKELAQWMARRTVRKQSPTEIATKTLKVSATKKVRND